MRGPISQLFLFQEIPDKLKAETGLHGIVVGDTMAYVVFGAVLALRSRSEWRVLI